MVDPTNISLDDQKECIEKNASHVTKSLEFAMKKLLEYYKGGAEFNGMSYNAVLGLYNSINDSLDTFKSINNRITENVNKKQPSNTNNIPRRFYK